MRDLRTHGCARTSSFTRLAVDMAPVARASTNSVLGRVSTVTARNVAEAASARPPNRRLDIDVFHGDMLQVAASSLPAIDQFNRPRAIGCVARGDHQTQPASRIERTQTSRRSSHQPLSGLGPVWLPVFMTSALVLPIRRDSRFVDR